jgi:hypothetical protein
LKYGLRGRWLRRISCTRWEVICLRGKIFKEQTCWRRRWLEILGEEMARNMGGEDGWKCWGKRRPKIWEEEMVRNVGGRGVQKYGRRRWLEMLGEEVARNMGGGDG